MSEKRSFSLKKRIESFKYAFAGLRRLFEKEHNAWIHAIAAVLAIALSYILHISAGEWIAVVIVIGMVFSAEIINSSIEGIADFISPQKDIRIRNIKDLGAAAVLVNAISAAVVGCIIFIPKLLELIG